MLAIAHVKFRRRFGVEAPVLNIADDTHNLLPWPVLWIVDRHASTDWRFVREVQTRQPLANHNDPLAGLGILLGKQTPLPQRNLHGVEITRRDDAVLHLEQITGASHGPAFDLE